MAITLSITSVERVRYLLPFSNDELGQLMSFMARRIGLGDYCLELSLLDDVAMAELNFSTMGTRNTTNILSFPLLYATFSPYIMVENHEEQGEGAFVHPQLNHGLVVPSAGGQKQFRPHDFGQAACFSADGMHWGSQTPYADLAEIPCSSGSSGFSGSSDACEVAEFAQSDVSSSLPMLGSLVMAVETVQREAFLYGQELDSYTVFLLAHGFAHLLGYDHGPAMDALMKSMEEGALDALYSGSSCYKG